MDERTALLPRQVQADLSGGRDHLVGAWLREEVETLARSSTDAASVLDPIESVADGRPILRAYLEWGRGIAAHLGGDVSGASSRLKAAMTSFDRLGLKDLRDRVGLLQVDVLGSSNDLTGARRLAGRLKRSFSGRGDDARAALTLAALAGAEDAADRVARAGQLWREALRHLDGRDLRTQVVRANLANVAMLEGRHDVAIKGHETIASMASSLGLDRLALQAETNLAEAEFASGHVDRALRRLHDVIDRSTGAGYAFEEAIARLEMAAMEIDLGDLKAAAHDLSGLADFFARSGLDPEWARVQRMDGLIEAQRNPHGWREAYQRLLDRDDTASASLFVVDVASIVPGVPADELERAAASLRRLGFGARAWLAQGLAAQRLVSEGRAERAKTLAADVVGTRRASGWARMIARSALAKAEPEYAGRHLAAAIRIADNLLGRLNATADRTAFFHLRRDLYLEAIARLVDRGRAADRHRALDLVHRFSAGWLMDELARRQDRGDDPDVKKWVRLRRRLATLLEEMEGESEPRLRRSGLRIRDQLRTLEGEIGHVQRSLARRWSGSLGVGTEPGIGDRLARLMPSGHRLIEFLPDGDDLLVFAVGGGRLKAGRLEAVGPALRRLVASARFHLDGRPWLTNGRGAQMDRAFSSTLQRLSRLLLDGIDLDDVDTLWVAPHGLLYGLPWAGLSDSRGGWLIDRMTISVVPGSAAAGRLLAETVDRPERFGLAGVPVEALPEIDDEIRELRDLFPGAVCAGNSDRASFLDMLKTCDAVHLAGHAVFLDGLPAASGLRMNDGFITVHDLAASRLNTRFVSFGVCSGTRIAESDPTRAEGFLRALIAGGVRTVVGSVAPVRDDVARAFSTALYSRLHSNWAPGEAWRGAVTELRASYPTPALWGAFQIFGDPRPWLNSKDE